MKYINTTIGFFLITLLIFLSESPGQSIYSANQTDLIFSAAQMNSTTMSTMPVLRFSGFLNYETQLHFDFGKSVGLYTGLGLKNIGMINRLDTAKIVFKQRAYALSIPLAIKLGNLKNQAYVSLGGEVNLMMHYKEKLQLEDTKIKRGEWFSDNLNLVNPAVFFQIRFLKSQVVTFKYFLVDFLRYQPGSLTLPNGYVVNDYGRSSKLFYVSWGIHIANKEPQMKQERKKEQPLKSAYLY